MGFKCSFIIVTDQLRGRRFDHIISGFGGLNCSPDLGSVLSRFSVLLNEGGRITLMIKRKNGFFSYM